MCPVAGLVLVQPAPAVGQAIRLTDDTGREIELAARPVRIVSLVPVATEILFGLQEGGRIVGRSRYDDYPPEALAIPSVGDAIRPAMEEILLKDPDLVILVGGSDNAGAVRELSSLGVPYVVVRFNTLADLRANVIRLGHLVGREAAAAGMWAGIDSELDAVRGVVAGQDRPRVYYDLGYPPAFTVGSGSYLDTLITIAGGRNVFHDLSVPAARVSLEAILARDPDVIVRPMQDEAEPPMSQLVSRPGWENLRAVKAGAAVPVPADLLHRLGPRVGRAAMDLARALHPDLGGSD
jgi:ABC-type Fe3+-hydroxamate transport system substrate-binding protein